MVDILTPLTALTRLSLAPIAPPTAPRSSRSVGTRLPDSICQLSQLVELELRGNRETGILQLPAKLGGLGQLTLLRFMDVLTALGRSPVAQLTALVELSVVAPAGKFIMPRPTPALPLGVSALQRLRVLRVSAIGACCRRCCCRSSPPCGWGRRG
jgi:hypothetical protein